MSLAAALIYWVIVTLWAAVFALIVVSYVRNPRVFGTTRLLLAVVAIDTLRNIFENLYFGVYFGGQYGLFPSEVVTVLGRPLLLILPKLLNVMAGSVVLGLLLLRWLPRAVREKQVSQEYTDHLESLATHDELTGLYNRRHFEVCMSAELARYQRHQRPLSLLMLDVDHFKSINDSFGHAAGDRVLARIGASCLAVGKRESDVAARIGGEEFAVLLPETNADAARAVAERLRYVVRDNAPVIDGRRLEVTVSIGVAEAAPGVSQTQALMEAADQALYAAKRAGRNRVCVATPAESTPASRVA